MRSRAMRNWRSLRPLSFTSVAADFSSSLRMSSLSVFAWASSCSICAMAAGFGGSRPHALSAASESAFGSSASSPELGSEAAHLDGVTTLLCRGHLLRDRHCLLPECRIGHRLRLQFLVALIGRCLPLVA